MSRFDYKHTCPDIDKSISSTEDYVNQHITSFIEFNLEPTSKLSRQGLEGLARSFTEELCSKINHCFEEVRECNSNMRDEADRQISALDDDLSDSEYEAEELRKECTRLEDRIQDLQSEIEDLRQEVEELNTQSEDVS